jgi:hypothetical protein
MFGGGTGPSAGTSATSKFVGPILAFYPLNLLAFCLLACLTTLQRALLDQGMLK